MKICYICWCIIIKCYKYYPRINTKLWCNNYFTHVLSINGADDKDDELENSKDQSIF